MLQLFRQPITLALFLLVATLIPTTSAVLRMYELILDQLPADAIKFRAVPWTMFLHSLGGFAFGVLGPLQFAGSLLRRFGKWHRICGHIFVAGGALLAFSSFRLLFEFPNAFTWVLICARAVAGAGLLTCLGLALQAIKTRRVLDHRAWMIRAYAIGMGQASVAFIMLPIFLIRGQAPEGYIADSLVLLSWIINIGLAEWVVRYLRSKEMSLQVA